MASIVALQLTPFMTSQARKDLALSAASFKQEREREMEEEGERGTKEGEGEREMNYCCGSGIGGQATETNIQRRRALVSCSCMTTIDCTHLQLHHTLTIVQLWR